MAVKIYEQMKLWKFSFYEAEALALYSVEAKALALYKVEAKALAFYYIGWSQSARIV